MLILNLAKKANHTWGRVIDEHFLDTSVAHPMLLGTTAYKRYFASQFGDDPCYISKYVQMEFKRTYLTNVIALYFTLDLPTMQTIGDAFAHWSNKFKTSELKAVIQLASQLFSTQMIDVTRVQDKSKALRELGRYIKRIELKLRRKFKDVGKDSTRCARALVPLKVEPENMGEGFRQFIDAFDDVETCRSKCRIDDFILKRYQPQVEAYVKLAAKLPRDRANLGFISIADNPGQILKKGAMACSCKRCEHIGDAVIALDAARNMRLEHTDNSFNHLCPSIGQPHQQHPSAVQVVKIGSEEKP